VFEKKLADREILAGEKKLRHRMGQARFAKKLRHAKMF
jgi:hypothetical protein